MGTSNGYGSSVRQSQHAHNECDNYLKSFAGGVLDTSKPCCLYTGQIGFGWAKDDCNALEATSNIKSITDEKGPNCEGRPQIQMCPNVAFPTMFWETASSLWAQFVDTAPGCSGEIFVLVPGIQDIDPKAIEEKISFRVELYTLKSIASQSQIYLVSDTSCKTLQ